MDTMSKIIIVMVVLVLAFNVSYKLALESKTGRYLTNMNTLCGMMTEELRNKIDSDSPCVDYYCYYAPYKPPEGYEDKTSTLCICECRLSNGTIMTTQVLGVTES